MIRIRKFIRINERIRVPEVRLIGPEGEQLGVVVIDKALEQASQHELDLVEVAPDTKPPVCRIMDFAKYKYDQEKKERQAKKNQHKVHLKEIRLNPNIDEHDYQIKVKQLLHFLEKGDKVKVSMMFRGRQMAHKELGRRIIDQAIIDTASCGQIERAPQLEGNVISMIIGKK